MHIAPVCRKMAMEQSATAFDVMLAEARQNALRLIQDLRQTSEQARDLANAMDFAFLLDKQRLLLSVGFDAQSEELQPYCLRLAGHRAAHRRLHCHRERRHSSGLLVPA